MVSSTNVLVTLQQELATSLKLLELNFAAPMTALNPDLEFCALESIEECWPNLKASNCTLQGTKIKVVTSIILGKLIAATKNQTAQRKISIPVHFQQHFEDLEPSLILLNSTLNVIMP
jgi:hypothetical protein